MRNLLLEDALSKVVKNPHHMRNPSAPNSAKPPVSPDMPPVPHPSNAEVLAKLYNSNRALEATISKLNAVSEELKEKEDQLLKTENQLRGKRKEN